MGTPDAPGLGDPFDLGAERLALALQSSDLGFWDFDLVNLKGSFTKACAEIFGLPHAAEPGQISYAEWLEAIHPEDRAKAQGDNRQRRAIRFIGIIRDVTQHQLQKKVIAEGEERFHRAIHEAPFLSWLAGIMGKWWNSIELGKRLPDTA